MILGQLAGVDGELDRALVFCFEAEMEVVVASGEGFSERKLIACFDETAGDPRSVVGGE